MPDIFFDECKMHPFVMRTITDAVSTLKQDQRDNKETFNGIERKIDRLDEKMDSQHDRLDEKMDSQHESTSVKITALEKAIIDFLSAQRGIEQGRAAANDEIKTTVRRGWRVLKVVGVVVGSIITGGGIVEAIRSLAGV